ncbi:prepilin-type N-terminal cleavage/methylation domain-containing protein [Moraxella catarrhalis]|uniref:prepilin-type N-terminal cleavage/methylation domain-containing protein n=1 Tax=Moraxella catarrhalis TaxID=480 RepID=UPI0007E4AB17|nr:prepilin-type N-terminal cleavage/methylation domain-containing protein [Moraxella catarrhalis]OAV11024.1 hypothetical protein AO377_0822 [Moraxella catarrhalis]OAV33198.1 hypothetical protein AO365_2004 [Moraxella catarrhalis]RKM36859.1 prepilin-type N-terminal cleavage/methylation domain-containing protein [Moraxella catarrhalis]
MTDNNLSAALITTNEGGFGLIEVLIALLLLSVVALGLITVQGRLLVQTKHADLRLQAVQLMANDYHAVRSFTPEQKQIYIQTLQRIAQTAQSRSESGMDSYRIAAYAAAIRCRPECHLNEQAQSLAIQSAQAAARANIILSVTDCQLGHCWVAGWGMQAFELIKTCSNDELGLNISSLDCAIMDGL